LLESAGICMVESTIVLVLSIVIAVSAVAVAVAGAGAGAAAGAGAGAGWDFLHPLNIQAAAKAETASARVMRSS
jgi:hypothetical protein